MRKLLSIFSALFLASICWTAASAEKSAVEYLKSESQFKSFAEAIEKSGLTEELSGKTSITVFVPTEEAWQKITDRENLFSDKNRLAEFVKAHVIAEQKIVMTGLETETQFNTMAGCSLKLDPARKVNGVAITGDGIEVTNGWIYPIESALQMKKEEQASIFSEPTWLADLYKGTLGLNMDWMKNLMKPQTSTFKPAAVHSAEVSNLPTEPAKLPTSEEVNITNAN